MVRRGTWLGLTVLLAIAGCDDAPGYAKAAQGSESEAAMSEDVRRMHERLIALSKGEGSTSGLRIEFMEGSVTDSRVSELLQQLIAKQYWTFQGTRFIPDAPMFLFRFYYGDLKYVDFRCGAEEFRKFEARSAIRSLFLRFASETKMKTVPAKP